MFFHPYPVKNCRHPDASPNPFSMFSFRWAWLHADPDWLPQIPELHDDFRALRRGYQQWNLRAMPIMVVMWLLFGLIFTLYQLHIDGYPKLNKPVEFIGLCFNPAGTELPHNQTMTPAPLPGRCRNKRTDVQILVSGLRPGGGSVFSLHAP